MDRAEFPTLRRPLIYCGRNTKNTMFVVPLFIDSISRNVFCEFQHPTGTDKSVQSKKNVERECQ